MAPESTPRSIRRSSEHGFGMLLLVFVLLVGAALSAGAIALVGNSQVSQLMPVQESRAYFVAKSGLEYARQALEAGGDSDLVALNGESRALPVGSFTLAVSPTTAGSPKYSVTSTGTVAAANATQGIHKLVAELTPPAGGGEDEDEDDGNTVEASDLVINTGNGALILQNQNDADGSVHGASVTLQNQVTVTGTVYSESSVTLENHATVGGDICAKTTVTLENHATVVGDINTEGNVSLGNHAEVQGSIYTKGNVDLQNGAEVFGDVHAGGTVHLGSNGATIHGAIYAGGGVSLDNLALAKKNVYSGDTIVLNWGGTIEGSAIAKSNITVNNGGKVKASALSGGNISVKWGGVISGNAEASGTVTVDSGGTVSGAVKSSQPAPTVVSPTPPLACPVLTAPTLTTFSAGSSAVTVDWNKNKILTPGNYGKLTLSGKNTLFLSGGTYTFSAIDATGNQPYFCMDLTGQDIVILVEGSVAFGNQFAVQVTNAKGTCLDMDDGNVPMNSAAKVFMESHGNVTFANQNEWFGTILAKNNITFANQGKLIGSYHSVNGSTVAANQLDFKFVASNYAKANW